MWSIATEFYGDSVKAAWGGGVDFFTGEEKAGGFFDLAPLFEVDGFERRAVLQRSARSDFDENENRAVKHHQVEFTATEPVIARLQPVTQTLKVFKCQVFAPAAEIDTFAAHVRC